MATSSDLVKGAGVAKRLYDSTSNVLHQDRARRQLAITLWRQLQIASGEDLPGAATLVTGRTGTGKSYLCRTMCNHCGLPFADVNATQFTEAGYVGLNLTQMYLPLLLATAREYDYQKRLDAIRVGDKFEEDDERTSPLERSHKELEDIAERASVGVILLDEFDKWIGVKDDQGRDKGKALQSELLRLIEGDKIWVSDSDERIGVQMDTSKILVIACGAFVGLEKIVSRRTKEENLNIPSAWEAIEPEDFIRFGLMPELAGRMSTYVMLTPLNVEALRAILSAPGSILEEYRRRFRGAGSELTWTDDGLVSIARAALKMEVGARSLRFILERVLYEALYEVGSGGRGEVTLNADAVTRRRAMVR